MLVHTVFFWLKDDLSEEDRQDFLKGLQTLQQIEHAERIHVGTPAATEPRPVIDRSYDFGLSVICQNVAQHDLYQEDPIHLTFVEQNSQYWEKVLVYDAEDV